MNALYCSLFRQNVWPASVSLCVLASVMIGRIGLVEEFFEADRRWPHTRHLRHTFWCHGVVAASFVLH